MSLTKVVRASFYTRQTIGTYAGVCACNRTYQMEKTEEILDVHPLVAVIH